MANLVISNVPGPDFPLYLGGAEMLGMFPLGPVMDGMGLNITIMSYRGVLYWGLVACARAVPGSGRSGRRTSPRPWTSCSAAAGIEPEACDAPSISARPPPRPRDPCSGHERRDAAPQRRTPDRCRSSRAPADRCANNEGDRMACSELGHLVLYVRDVGRSAAFYRDVLGWRPDPARTRQAPTGGPQRPSRRVGPTTSCCSSRWVPTPQPMPAGRRVGLYHFGLKVGDTDDDLREVLARVQRPPGPRWSGRRTTR